MSGLLGDLLGSVVGGAMGGSTLAAGGGNAQMLNHGQASTILAQLLPQVVNHLTPQGQVGGEHAGLLGDVAKQLLGGKLFG